MTKKRQLKNLMNMKIERWFLFALLWVGSLLTSFAQPAKQYVTVTASPDHADWVYRVGEQAQFTLYAVKDNEMLPGVVIDYQYGPEKLAPVFKGQVTTDRNGQAKIKVPGAKAPGFITVRVSTQYEGTTYSGYTTIGFEPEKILPTTTLPDDFTEFWEDAKAQAAKVPMEVKIRRDDNQSTDWADVYYVRIQSYRKGNYVYGVLTVPKGEGPFPGVLRLPGAAVRAFSGPNSLAAEGMVVLEIGIHGIPVDQDREIYLALQSGSLAGYSAMGLESRNTFYYKRVYMGCLRALDYLCSLDSVDENRIAVYGGSQGGMLSIVTAALDSRVKYMVCQFPAFCDVTGYYNGRAGGWPHLFINCNETAIQEKINTSKYFDTVNFARFVRIPGFYTWGFNDLTCCPTSTYSAYNVIDAPKELHLALDSGHWTYPWQVRAGIDWLKEKFGIAEVEE